MDFKDASISSRLRKKTSGVMSGADEARILRICRFLLFLAIRDHPQWGKPLHSLRRQGHVGRSRVSDGCLNGAIKSEDEKGRSGGAKADL